jgi:hypothetical protein
MAIWYIFPPSWHTFPRFGLLHKGKSVNPGQMVHFHSKNPILENVGVLNRHFVHFLLIL